MAKRSVGIVMFLVVLGVTGSAVYFYTEADRAKEKADALVQGIGVKKPKSKAKIWIGSDECKTTLGLNTVAFCDGVSKDNSLFLNSGADAAVKVCFEYTAKKMGRPITEARDIACEVKAAYQDRQFEYDMKLDMVGIKNNNYEILNEWVNR